VGGGTAAAVFTGIAARQAGVQPVVLAAWAGAGAVLIVFLIAAVRRRWVSA
jgi:hypothetical protein